MGILLVGKFKDAECHLKVSNWKNRDMHIPILLSYNKSKEKKRHLKMSFKKLGEFPRF